MELGHLVGLLGLQESVKESVKGLDRKRMKEGGEGRREGKRRRREERDPS